jgi:glycosyltransferase involved in cell wall biosynthesis
MQKDIVKIGNWGGDPLVSVLIPVYNTEKYLRQCLDSIANQTYSNLQIICIDDSSTDNCPTILGEYAAKDSRFHIIHQKENILITLEISVFIFCNFLR